MYTIYHIPGTKVGCSHDFKARKNQYPKGTIFEILDLIPDELGEKFAGDIEWFYADYYGYEKGLHYAEFNWNLILTSNQRSEASRNSALVQFAKGTHPSQTKAWQSAGGRRTAELGLGLKTMTPEQRAIASRLGVESKRSGFYTFSQCPHCGEIGKTAPMHRWHFDNCKFKGLTEINLLTW